MRSNASHRRFPSLIARFFLLLFPFNLGHAGEAHWTAGQPGENLFFKVHFDLPAKGIDTRVTGAREQLYPLACESMGWSHCFDD